MYYEICSQVAKQVLLGSKENDKKETELAFSQREQHSFICHLKDTANTQTALEKS